MNEEASTTENEDFKNQVTVWVDDLIWKYVTRFGIMISILGALGFLTVWNNLRNYIETSVREKLPKETVEDILKLHEDFPKYERLLKQFPVGSIIPVGLKTNQESLYEEILPRNWVLCDGKKIDEKHPRQFKFEEVSTQFWNEKVPDLNGKFLRGTIDLNSVGNEVGDKNHSHTLSISGTTDKPLPQHLAQAPDKPNQEQFGDRLHTHPLKANGTANEVEYIPPSIEVFYIIKIAR